MGGAVAGGSDARPFCGGPKDPLIHWGGQCMGAEIGGTRDKPGSGAGGVPHPPFCNPPPPVRRRSQGGTGGAMARTPGFIVTKMPHPRFRGMSRAAGGVLGVADPRETRATARGDDHRGGRGFTHPSPLLRPPRPPPQPWCLGGAGEEGVNHLPWSPSLAHGCHMTWLGVALEDEGLALLTDGCQDAVDLLRHHRQHLRGRGR